MTVLYLLDANIIIDSKDRYYQFDRVPEFWTWLAYQGKQNNIKIPCEIYEELQHKDKTKKYDLTNWIASHEVKQALLFKQEAEPTYVQEVTNTYACDLTDSEIETIGNDALLISYALNHKEAVTIVTSEGTKPSLKRANRRIPDICKQLKISCCNCVNLIEALDFKTSWKAYSL